MSFNEKTEPEEYFKLLVNEQFICKFDAFNNHLLKDCRVLPCHNVSCMECIRKYMNVDGTLYCTFCSKEHKIQNVEALKQESGLEDHIEKNANYITESLLDQFRQMLTDLISTFGKREAMIDVAFKQTSEAVKARVNKIKTELDVLYDKFMQELNRMRADAKDSLNVMTTQIKKQALEYDQFSQKLTETLIASNKNTTSPHVGENGFHDVNSPDGSTSSRSSVTIWGSTNSRHSTLNSFTPSGTFNSNYKQHSVTFVDKDLIYECEDKINELRDCKECFDSIFNRLYFEPSDWKATAPIIGKLYPPSLSEFGKRYKTADILVVSLKNIATDPYSICEIDDNLLTLTDRKRNLIYFFDLGLTVKKTISSIGHIALKKPTAICADDVDNVYVYDQDLATLIITDKKFQIVKSQINDNFIDDLCYYQGTLYVLDRLNSTLRLFKRDGVFIRGFRLYKKPVTQCGYEKSKEYWLQNPLRIDVSTYRIAVLENHIEIYLYDFNLRLKQIIGTYVGGHNWSLKFVDQYLFIHSESGLLTCYEAITIKSPGGPKGENNGEVFYSPMFNRDLKSLNFSWHVRCFNGRLILLAESIGRKVLVAI